MTAFQPLCRALLLVSSLARSLSAEPQPAELTRARELFADAVALEAAGKYDQAATKLEVAVAIKETPGLRYHLAHCQEQLGALVAASGNYQRASELISQGASAPDVEPLLPLAASRLDSRVAKLEIVVPDGVEVGAELDGRTLPRSALGAAVRLDPGPHRLRVFSPGHADFKADLSFSSGEHRTVKVLFDSPALPVAAAPRAVVAPQPAVSPAATQQGGGGIGGREVVLLSEAALTLTALGLGIGFSVARSNAEGRVEQAQANVDAASSGATNGCEGAPAAPACADLERALDDHQHATAWATASFIGAGAAAGALALTWALWPSSPRAVSIELHPQAAGVRLLAGGEF